MKKLLLVSTAIAGVAFMAAPAHAALKMDLGGYFRGYGVWADNNELDGAGTSLHNFEFRRDNEIHVTGETTLDNGLTVGAHTELKIANGSNTVDTDETYGYASGGWGRVNLGAEDGAAYLLQVAAPSADSNVDGMRVYIQALNPLTAVSAPAVIGATVGGGGIEDFSTVIASGSFNNLDYAHSDFQHTDRLTYLTPKFNGFQAGVSYAPKNGWTSNTGAMSLDNNTTGFVDQSAAANDTVAAYKNLWEAAARWDGEFQGVAISLGGGYSDNSLNHNSIGDGATADGDYTLNDGIKTWNGGASVAMSGFSLGGAYKHSETSRGLDGLDAGGIELHEGDITSKTWVVGLGYDNGPYHAGASYLHNNIEAEALTAGTNTLAYDATKYTTTKFAVGGGYTYGPGMTFRGSVAWGKFNPHITADEDNRYTQVAVGTDIQF